MRALLAGISVCAFLLISGAALAQNQVAEAQQLIKENKAAQAYALLEPLEPEQAGNPEFDYWFGVAALDSGKFERAAVAFERVLIQNPNFASARLDLARTYFAMHSDDLAKQEFERVLEQEPNAAGRAVVAKYLEAIEERKKGKRFLGAGYLEAGFGRDDNISSVTNDFTGSILSSYNIPFVLPTGNSIKRRDNYSTVAGGGEASYKLGEDWSLFGGLDGRGRRYREFSQFNIAQWDARLGTALQQGADTFRLSVQGQRYRQDGDAPVSLDQTQPTSDRNSNGLGIEWRRNLGAADFSLSAQFNRLRYPTNQTQDTDQTLVSASYIREWEMPGKPVLFANIYGSKDDAVRPLNEGFDTDVGRTVFGARVFGQYSFNSSVDTFALLGASRRKDDSPFARSTVIEEGRDTTYDFTLGLILHLGGDWSVRAQATHTRNTSTIPLYEYRRTDASVVVRRDFH
jgi:outer membrane protein